MSRLQSATIDAVPISSHDVEQSRLSRERFAEHPDVTYFQQECYAGTNGRSPLLPIYYTLKPLIPRRLQLAMRRRFAAQQLARSFPAWPIEPILIDHFYDQMRERLRGSAEDRLPMINLWPERHGFAFVLTHDVEGPKGVANIERVLEIERRHGFVSSWNFVAEWYPIPAGTFERLDEAGCEVGLHGVTHDGKLFQSRARFEADLPKIHSYLSKWGSVGFRSPATHRNAEWMHELGCLYDSSFPDSDPFEPQSGGCCSILPFMLDELVELPITLVQDHTLMEILQQTTIELWATKSQWIIENHGLINLITHPDYLDTPEHLALYDEFLGFLASQSGGWHALPREVAQWWKTRERITCVQTSDGPQISGDPDGQASIAWAHAADGELLIEL
jgi:peptidoglycan/xylan/chitin deacetylase (PgdA/CDA1 family)